MIFLNNITQIHKGYSYNKTQKSWKIAGKLWELLIEYEKNNNEIKINTIIYKEYIEDGSLYQCAQIGGYYNWDGYVYEQLKKYEIYFDNEYKNIIKLSKSFV